MSSPGAPSTPPARGRVSSLRGKPLSAGTVRAFGMSRKDLRFDLACVPTDQAEHRRPPGQPHEEPPGRLLQLAHPEDVGEPPSAEEDGRQVLLHFERAVRRRISRTIRFL